MHFWLLWLGKKDSLPEAIYLKPNGSPIPNSKRDFPSKAVGLLKLGNLIFDNLQHAGIFLMCVFQVSIENIFRKLDPLKYSFGGLLRGRFGSKSVLSRRYFLVPILPI